MKTHFPMIAAFAVISVASMSGQTLGFPRFFGQ